MITHTSVNGGVDGLLKRLKELTQKDVYVGVPSEKNAPHGDSGLNNATLVAIQNLGAPTRNIPPRPFLIPSIESNADKYKTLLAQGITNALVRGENPDIVLEKLGVVISNDVKQYIVDGKFEPLSKRTERAKKSTKPLIDTGAMRQSITYIVR